MKFSSISNIGKLRDTNEDSYGNVSTDNYDFFIVADGMGGHSDGELASSLASKSYIDYIKNTRLEDFNSVSDLQDVAISYANEKVFELANKKDEKMGTTVVCLCLDYREKEYHINHIGDSRLYLYREGELKQVTKDHSLINELIDSGALKEDEAKNFINKNAITRAVGINSTVESDYKSIKIKDNDIIIVATDGLFNEVSDGSIIEIIEENEDPYDISLGLIDAANASGGHDNITVTTIKM